MTAIKRQFKFQTSNNVSLDLCYRFPVPFYPGLIQLRLQNDYYRNVEGVKHDIMVMLSNAEEFFRVIKNGKLQRKVERISEWLGRKLERI